jgi:hypothetical protein
MLGMRPLLWWPLRREVIEALAFRRFIVTTLFNPAFLIKDLRELGFEITCKRGTDLRITKPLRGASLDFKGFEYFNRLIQRYLFPEKAVCRFVQQTFTTLDATDFPFPAVIHLDMNFEFNS